MTELCACHDSFVINERRSRADYCDCGITASVGVELRHYTAEQERYTQVRALHRSQLQAAEVPCLYNYWQRRCMDTRT